VLAEKAYMANNKERQPEELEMVGLVMTLMTRLCHYNLQSMSRAICPMASSQIGGNRLKL
jgi:hypothetical protein